MNFEDILSHPGLRQAIKEAGYSNPTPIQCEAIPQILAGKDLLASAQTGTGKTAAFTLPCLERLATNPVSGKGVRGPRVLVLVPTRELAMQVANEAAKYSKHLSQMKTVCIYGGAPYPIQNRQLSAPYEILVATPGRLIDHINSGRINFSRLEMLILDEADRMLDMGFVDDVNDIAEKTPKNRQTLLFSATLKGAVLKLAKSLLQDPVTITIAAAHEKHENIEQRLHNVDNIEHKYRLLEALLIDPTLTQAVVFTATKSQADVLADKLQEMGHSAEALHGDMRQQQRTRTITKMRQSKIKILVATDVAARGIDVQTVTHVINFDLPMTAEDYVHRIGRTGRAGSSGIAISFASAKDRHLVAQIERFTGHKLVAHTIAGLEPKNAGGAPRGGDRGDRGGFRGGFRGGERRGGGYGGGNRAGGDRSGQKPSGFRRSSRPGSGRPAGAGRTAGSGGRSGSGRSGQYGQPR